MEPTSSLIELHQIPKFQASSLLLRLYSPVCVRSGRRPRTGFLATRLILPYGITSWFQLSHVMRKPTFCICENKDADQRLCFRYIDSTIPCSFQIQIFKPLAIFCSCTAWFVSDLGGNQNVSFLMTWLNYRVITANISGVKNLALLNSK